MHRRGYTVSRKCQKLLCVGWMGASVGVKWQMIPCLHMDSMASSMMWSSWVMGVGASGWQRCLMGATGLVDCRVAVVVLERFGFLCFAILGGGKACWCRGKAVLVQLFVHCEACVP
jgi:hypothetical protein